MYYSISFPFFYFEQNIEYESISSYILSTWKEIVAKEFPYPTLKRCHPATWPQPRTRPRQISGQQIWNHKLRLNDLEGFQRLKMPHKSICACFLYFNWGLRDHVSLISSFSVFSMLIETTIPTSKVRVEYFVRFDVKHTWKNEELFWWGWVGGGRVLDGWVIFAMQWILIYDVFFFCSARNSCKFQVSSQDARKLQHTPRTHPLANYEWHPLCSLLVSRFKGMCSERCVETTLFPRFFGRWKVLRQMEIKITAHHKGHFEFSICHLGGEERWVRLPIKKGPRN